ncbi:MAG: transcriptional repressor [Dehalococcoidia bacterium]|nr:transcriptional repressor [Dehalococcoidia bacterium]
MNIQRRNDKDINRILHEKGYRITPQRTMILHAISHRTGHFSAEEIYAQVKPQYPQFNISTVYRTLEMLEGIKLVTKTNLGDGRTRYHTEEKGHHHHLVCQQCGAITDMSDDIFNPLRKQLKRQYDFDAILKHVAVFGTCSKCQKK